MADFVSLNMREEEEKEKKNIFIMVLDELCSAAVKLWERIYKKILCDLRAIFDLLIFLVALIGVYRSMLQKWPHRKT